MLSKSILQYNHQGYTLVALFAQDGDVDAVNELLEMGAKPNDAVYGYALGGYVELAIKTMQRPRDIGLVITGLIRGKHINEAMDTLGKHSNHKDAMVEGNAQAGNIDQVEHALKTQANDKYKRAAVRGYAMNGDCQETLLFLLKGSNLYEEALAVAAQSGNQQTVTAILEQLNVDLKTAVRKPVFLPGFTSDMSDVKVKQYVYDIVLYHYAKGRHYKMAAEMIKLGATPQRCFDGFNETFEDDYDLSADVSMVAAHLDPEGSKALLDTLQHSQLDKVEKKNDVPKKVSLHILKQAFETNNKAKLTK